MNNHLKTCIAMILMIVVMLINKDSYNENIDRFIRYNGNKLNQIAYDTDQ